MSREFGLILTGDELMSGRRADKHLPHVIDMLAEKGLALSWMHCIGDDPKRIEETLHWAYQNSLHQPCCVFVSGGIGSTPDDHTRQCAAKAVGQGLELHPEAKELILQRAEQMAKDKGEILQLDATETLTRLEMGVFPKGARIIPNAYNKIPGFSYGDMHFFPGFPVMAWPMMEWVLAQYYANDFKEIDHIEQSVIVYDIGEASLTPLMVALENEFPGVKVFSLPSVDHPTYGAHIELGVKGLPVWVNAAFPAMLERLQKTSARLGEKRDLAEAKRRKNGA